MTEKAIVGLKPWLPDMLERCDWWTEPIRAERLAAVRIGVGAVLLADILWTYVPRASDFFGIGSLGSPEVFADRLNSGWRWSLLAGVADHGVLLAALLAWAASAACLILGIYSRLAACVAWALAVSVQNANFYLHNSGDNVRQIL